MVRRGGRPACVTANLIWAALAPGNSDQSKAMAPVTNGAAALVPEEVWGLPSVPRLTMFSPGAVTPQRPMELPRFDSAVGRPCRSQADNRDHPGMARYGGAADCPLVTRRDHHQHSPVSSVIQGLLELVFPARRWIE